MISRIYLICDWSTPVLVSKRSSLNKCTFLAFFPEILVQAQNASLVELSVLSNCFAYIKRQHKSNVYSVSKVFIFFFIYFVWITYYITMRLHFKSSPYMCMKRYRFMLCYYSKNKSNSCFRWLNAAALHSNSKRSHIRYFKHPFLQAWALLFSESLCLIIFNVIYYVLKHRQVRHLF